MFLWEGKLNDFIIENMMQWRHSGFNLYCGKTIRPDNDEGLENLARHIIRASFKITCCLNLTYKPINAIRQDMKIKFLSFSK